MHFAIFAAALAAGIGLLASGAAHAEKAPEWQGRYSYTEDGGRNAGGAAIIVTHEIAVTRDGTQYKAEITANGYQTQTHVFAQGTATGSKLQLRFEREGADQMFKGRYKPGALLLELERNGAKRILTHWGAYTPATRERFRNPGVYFKRD
jgi:hypothetical protein